MASVHKANSEDDLDQKAHSVDSVTEKPPLSQTPTPPPRHIPQSDSGICLTPLSQASVLSPQQTVPEVSEDGKESDVGGSQLPSSVSVVSPAPAQHEDASAASPHPGTVLGGEDGSPTPLSGKCSSSPSPDDFTYQTKYLVLQFLHQSTTESHLLPLSHNSLSTTSESEPRFRSYAERLRKHWQKNRSQSSPTSPEPRTRPNHAKLKGSKSSPNLKDANFFKDMPPQRKPRPKRAPRPKPGRGSRKSSSLTRMSPVQAVVASSLIRSVSETTENSETGTYTSDADDELDTSFDSSQQGSTTSASFRNRLAHYHHQAFSSTLPTVQSETESVVEVPVDFAEESIVADHSPLPIMDVSSNSVDHQPVLTADQFGRVASYLDQMRETRANMSSSGIFQANLDPEAGHNNTDGDRDDEANMEAVFPEHLMPQRGEAPAHLEPPDQTEDGAVSGGFEPDTTSGDFLQETEGAWGGVDVNDADNACNVRYGERADRSKLRLDIHDQDTMFLMEAVHSLRQEIEEEISSFESELEEAIQSHHSECSWSLQGLSRSHSGSPETAEIARRLARIGDEVQQKYFDQLEMAVGRLFLDNCAGLFTYENFREAAMMALDADVHGWKQVATVLLYSQHVALHLAQSGRRTLHRIIDYTVRLLADTAAEFIINQGGWSSISALGESSPPSSPEVSGTIPPTFHASGSTRPPSQDSHLSRRSVSAPNLHPTPESQNSSDPLSLTRPPPSGNAPVVHSTSAMADISSQPTPSWLNQAVGEEKTEQGSDEKRAEAAAEGETSSSDARSADVGSGVSPGVLTGCAVSVALIGVGVAVVFSFIRG